MRHFNESEITYISAHLLEARIAGLGNNTRMVDREALIKDCVDLAIELRTEIDKRCRAFEEVQEAKRRTDEGSSGR